MPCCRPAPRSARIAPRIRRTSRASLETRAPTFRPSCRTSAARPGPPKGDRKPHPICPRRSARPFACLLYGCVGCDAQPLACLDERLEPPADELGPAIHGSEDGASSIPTLDNEPAELWLESQTGGIRA